MYFSHRKWSISVSHKNVEFVHVHPFHTQDNPVPDYEEVESNEEPQHSSYIRHQGEGGVGGHLLQNLDLVVDECWPQDCNIFIW